MIEQIGKQPPLKLKSAKIYSIYTKIHQHMRNTKRWRRCRQPAGHGGAGGPDRVGRRPASRDGRPPGPPQPLGFCIFLDTWIYLDTKI